MRRSFALFVLLLATTLAPTAASQELTPPWVDLGFALPGTLGEPVLVASGTLVAESGVEVSLGNCAPLHHAYLVIGLGVVYAPYKGGTLVPYPHLLLQYSTGLSGSVKLLAHWPPGVPAGTPVVMQFWIDDPGAVAGRAGSNAVGALTP